MYRYRRDAELEILGFLTLMLMGPLTLVKGQFRSPRIPINYRPPAGMSVVHGQHGLVSYQLIKVIIEGIEF